LNITILNGNITAVRSRYRSDIGNGYGSNGNSLIDQFTANNLSPDGYGSGIGSGYEEWGNPKAGRMDMDDDHHSE
jgi:hypothetical protein